MDANAIQSCPGIRAPRSENDCLRIIGCELVDSGGYCRQYLLSIAIIRNDCVIYSPVVLINISKSKIVEIAASGIDIFHKFSDATFGTHTDKFKYSL